MCHSGMGWAWCAGGEGTEETCRGRGLQIGQRRRTWCTGCCMHKFLKRAEKVLVEATWAGSCCLPNWF